MLATWVSLALCAVGPGALKLAAPGLTSVNMPSEVGSFYSEHLAHQLARQGLDVVTQQQIVTLLGFERQKALLGCSDSSCMAELANALGVDGIVTGQLGKFEDVYQLDVKIVSATTGHALAAYTGQVSGDKRLLEELSSAARSLAASLKARPTSAAEAPAPIEEPLGPEPVRPYRKWSWVPAAGGAVAAGVGAGLVAMTKGWASQLNNPGSTLTYATAASYRDQGPALQGLGYTLGAVGVAAIAAGVAMFFWPGDSAVSLSPVAAGLPGLTLGGAWR